MVTDKVVFGFAICARFCGAWQCGAKRTSCKGLDGQRGEDAVWWALMHILEEWAKKSQQRKKRTDDTPGPTPKIPMTSGPPGQPGPSGQPGPTGQPEPSGQPEHLTPDSSIRTPTVDPTPAADPNPAADPTSVADPTPGDRTPVIASPPLCSNPVCPRPVSSLLVCPPPVADTLGGLFWWRVVGFG
jgi:hypothetical protein